VGLFSPVIDIQGGNGSEKLGFFGVTPVVQRTTYTVTNDVTDRIYNANSTTVGDCRRARYIDNGS